MIVQPAVDGERVPEVGASRSAPDRTGGSGARFPDLLGERLAPGDNPEPTRENGSEASPAAPPDESDGDHGRRFDDMPSRAREAHSEESSAAAEAEAAAPDTALGELAAAIGLPTDPPPRSAPISREPAGEAPPRSQETPLPSPPAAPARDHASPRAVTTVVAEAGDTPEPRDAASGVETTPPAPATGRAPEARDKGAAATPAGARESSATASASVAGEGLPATGDTRAVRRDSDSKPPAASPDPLESALSSRNAPGAPRADANHSGGGDRDPEQNAAHTSRFRGSSPTGEPIPSSRGRGSEANGALGAPRPAPPPHSELDAALRPLGPEPSAAASSLTPAVASATPSSSSTAPDPGTPVPPGALEGRIAWLAQHGGGSARVTLHPPHLGAVDLRVRIRHGRVEVSVVAHEAVARTVLEGSRDLLVQGLAARDLRVDSFVVSAPHADGASSGSFGTADGSGGHPREAFEPSSGARTGAGAGRRASRSSSPGMLSPAPVLARGAERVDLRI